MEIKFKKSPRIPANRYIAWGGTICYFVIIISIIVFIATGDVKDVFYFIKDKKELEISNLTLVFLCLDVVSILFLIFSFLSFEWFLNTRLQVHKDKLVFLSDDVIAALGSPTTSYTIKSIDKFKVKSKSIIVWGYITKKEPLRNNVKVNKCEIVGLYDKEDKNEVIETLKAFRELVQ